MKITRNLCLVPGLAMALIVSGCAGGGDGPSTTVDPTVVPASAGASPAAFMAFLGTLSDSDETSEPLTLGDNFAVPDDDANDPQPLT